MSLISHIENTLGQLDLGWSFRESSSQVQVVRFRNKPFDGVVTYLTLGLSNFLLSVPQERELRQKLIFTAYEKFSSEKIASFILSFCDYILARNQALLRGDVVGPTAPIIPNVAVISVYASIPVVFDEGFSTYKKSLPHTMMVWLIPLLKEEVCFVKTNGWSRF